MTNPKLKRVLEWLALAAFLFVFIALTMVMPFMVGSFIGD